MSVWESPARRLNQSVLTEINPGCSLEDLMLKLKLQYFGHLMQRADWLEKTLMRGKIEGRRRRGWRGWDGWMASLTQGRVMSLSKLWEMVKEREAWRATVHRVTKSWTWLSDWTELGLEIAPSVKNPRACQRSNPHTLNDESGVNT